MARFQLFALADGGFIDAEGHQWHRHEVTPLGITAGDYVLAAWDHLVSAILPALMYADPSDLPTRLRTAICDRERLSVLFAAIKPQISEGDEVEESDDPMQPRDGISREFYASVIADLGAANALEIKLHNEARAKIKAARDRMYATAAGIAYGIGQINA